MGAEFSTAEEAWQKCERGDWMLWIAGKLSKSPRSQSRKTLVLAACECARLSLKYLPPKETRPQKAIEMAESWARHKGRYSKASAAAYAAAASAAVNKNREEILRQCADIVRKWYPHPPTA